MTEFTESISAAGVAAMNESRQCTATAKSTGQRCQRECAPSMPVCEVHGANPATKRKAQAWQAVDAIMPLWQPDAPPVRDPVEKLSELAGLADAAMRAAGQQVAELREWDSYDMKGTAQLKGVVQLLLQLMKLCESILTTLAKLGIDERRVQVAEREQLLIIAALRSIAGDPELALTPGQRQAWESVVPRHLKAIMSAPE